MTTDEREAIERVLAATEAEVRHLPPMSRLRQHLICDARVLRVMAGLPLLGATPKQQEDSLRAIRRVGNLCAVEFFTVANALPDLIHRLF